MYHSTAIFVVAVVLIVVVSRSVDSRFVNASEEAASVDSGYSTDRSLDITFRKDEQTFLGRSTYVFHCPSVAQSSYILMLGSYIYRRSYESTLYIRRCKADSQALRCRPSDELFMEERRCCRSILAKLYRHTYSHIWNALGWWHCITSQSCVYSR